MIIHEAAPIQFDSFASADSQNGLPDIPAPAVESIIPLPESVELQERVAPAEVPIEESTQILPSPVTTAEVPVCDYAGCPTGDVVTPQCIGPLRFADYPYVCGIPGVMAHGLQKKWAGSFRFEYGSSFDGLDRRGVNLLFEHSSRVGIDFHWDSYREDLGGGFSDELHLGDVNVLFRVAQAENYLIRAGLGVNILGDAYGSDAGFNVTAKADLFPIKPLIISGELDVGTIGDAELFHVAGRAGFAFNRFEIFGGYDYRTIGGIPLQGPMMGIQVWF